MRFVGASARFARQPEVLLGVRARGEGSVGITAREAGEPRAAVRVVRRRVAAIGDAVEDRERFVEAVGTLDEPARSDLAEQEAHGDRAGRSPSRAAPEKSCA